MTDAAQIAALRRRAFAALRPPPVLTLSQWADANFVMSPESSSEPGRWTTLPFQRGPMDAISDSRNRKVTWMKSARVGATKAMVAAIGFHADQDPCSVLVLQPTDEDAKGFSTEEIQPMFRDVKCLKGRSRAAAKADGRPGRSTMLKLQTAGGTLTIAGARSPGNFRRITVRKVFRDEVDAYEVSKEGDPISLSAKRTQTAYAPQEVNASTPTIKGHSFIEREFEASDQRRYHVPCPHCGEKQVLTWAGVKWTPGDPDGAYYQCAENGCVIEEKHKSQMIAAGEWIAAKPFDGHAGFHICALYSPFPNARWGMLARDFIEAKNAGPAKLQVFVNTVLGETWDIAGEATDPESLIARRESWGDFPRDAVLVTAGVDIQDDRFELEFVGWAPNDETWSLDYVRWFGDPSSPQFWSSLDEQLARKWTHPSGRILGVETACVDSGGHYSDAVYAYTRARFRDRVFAIKGASDFSAPIWPRMKAKAPKKDAIVFMIGVSAAKMLIMNRLKVTSGSGFCHFPVDRGGDYFAGLTAEKLVTKYVKGFPKREWVKQDTARNEPLDCRVYATAARVSMRVDLHARANEMAQTRPVAKPVVRRPGGFIERRDNWLGAR